MRHRYEYGGRTYIIDNVCMRIYDSENRLIQMLSLIEARTKYGDILERIECPIAIDRLSLQ